jgi:RNA polymerase sigma-70 factor, ECF subfamily
VIHDTTSLELDLPACDVEPNSESTGETIENLAPTLWKRVFLHAYSLVGNHSEAEDLTQEAFVALLHAEQAGRPAERVAAWMWTVTKRLAYRRFRESRPDLHISLGALTANEDRIVWETPDTRPSPEEQVVDRAMLQVSARVLSEFSERERECVLMYFRGYDYAQIAKVLGTSRWTARRLTLEVVKELRARMLPAPKR